MSLNTVQFPHCRVISVPGRPSTAQWQTRKSHGLCLHGIAALQWQVMSLYDDTLDLLQELIRNACVNDLTADSGEEYRNAATLEKFFEGTDVKVQKFEPHPGRVSVAFTVEGSDPQAEPLTLLGRIDGVRGAEPRGTKPRLEARIESGKLYGPDQGARSFITPTGAALTCMSAQCRRPRSSWRC